MLPAVIWMPSPLASSLTQIPVFRAVMLPFTLIETVPPPLARALIASPPATIRSPVADWVKVIPAPSGCVSTKPAA